MHNMRQYCVECLPRSSSRWVDTFDLLLSYMANAKSTVQESLRRPLSELIRPSSLENVVGQEHLLSSSNGSITNFITLGYLPSMILYGPPGVGKTTLAKLLAEKTFYVFREFSATDATLAQLRELSLVILEENKKRSRRNEDRLRAVIFIDEIHRFTTAQQDVLLPFIESGSFVFIGATTVDPKKRIRRAILSRCQLFELKQLSKNDVKRVVEKAIVFENIRRRMLSDLPALDLEEGSADVIASYAHGDGRTAVNFIELLSSKIDRKETRLTKKEVESSIRSLTKVRFGLHNEQNVKFLVQLYDFMNQKQPSDTAKLTEARQHVHYEHDEAASRCIVTVDVKGAMEAASDLESCQGDVSDDEFSDDDMNEPGPIYLDEEEEVTYSNRVSRTKYFVQAAAHTMLKLLADGELPHLIMKYLILYNCVYVDVGSSKLPNIMAVHKSLQKATINPHVALTNCIEQLTFAKKWRGELITRSLRLLKAYFSSSLPKAEKDHDEGALQVVYDHTLLKELLTDPRSKAETKPSMSYKDVCYDFEESDYTLGKSGMSLLE